jgi:predicted extracellular nuclease
MKRRRKKHPFTFRKIIGILCLTLFAYGGYYLTSENHAQGLDILPFASGQARTAQSFDLTEKRVQDFRVMFYNVENLFDTYDDPTKNDNDFLPNGSMRWTNSRYYSHLRKTAQVITAIGEWGTPALCGLCEVENDTVLVHLLNRTPLREQHYSYCITTGSDQRGINNALIYQRDKFKYLGHSSERIRFSNPNRRSRDILHVWGEIITGEQLHIFVCHFPSRSGGEKETEPDRIEAAQTLRRLCDSLFHINEQVNIIVMGDFNDNPSDKSIQTITIGSKPEYSLTNLFGDPKKLNFHGSHKFQNEWSQLDQMMISQNWNRYLKTGSPQMFAADFLLTKKNNRGEQSLIRNYTGTIYRNGYSDHLPIFADFLVPFGDF